MQDGSNLVDIGVIGDTLPGEYLWRQKDWSAQKRLSFQVLVQSTFFRQAKVSKFDVTVGVDQDVVWLQVAVDYIH